MRIAIIGTGWGTRVQIPAFRSAGLEIVGLAAHNAEKTRAEAARLGVPAFATWRELLDTDADAISIVTPPATHREMALAALAAGKHVLCEKPTALDSAAAAAMAEAAASRPGQWALIDHELRFHPLYQAARAAIAEIGPIRHVFSSVVGPSRADATRPWNWWSDKEQGGGIWGAIGSHQLDTLRWLCGEISAIRATLHTFVAERPYEGGARAVTSDDAALAHVRFAAGGLGAITISMVGATGEKDTLTVHGAAGAVRIEGAHLHRADPGGEWIDQTPEHTVEIPEGIAGAFPVGTVYLGHALRASGQGDGAALAPAATFADGLRTQRLLDAGRRSDDADGGWVAV
jgi:predicted dehydrogenase